MPDARFMYLDSEEIPFGMFDGLFDERLAVAEADLQHDWRSPAKYFSEIERASLNTDPHVRPQFLQRTLL